MSVWICCHSTARRALILAALMTSLLSPCVVADAGTYQLPASTLVDLIDASPTPQAMLSPDHAWLLLRERRSLVSIDELAAPELRLAGLRLDPVADARSRRRTYAGLTLVSLADGATRTIDGLPPEARIDSVTFSPDGRHLAFVLQTDPAAGWTLWTAAVASGKAARVSSERLHLAARIAPVWLADSQHLAAALVPANRAAAPVAPNVPVGPVVRENSGTKAAARTYQDLLSNPHDEALFRHHLLAQIGVIGLDGQVERLGQPGLLWHLDPSPDGRYLAVGWIEPPFSYLVPASRFPRRVEVLDRAGRQVRLIAELSLQESVPTAFGSVPTGPRELTWRADAPATLMWVEALDDGDAGRPADQRDQLFLLPAPFTAAPVSWVALKYRFGGIQWGRDDLALVDEWWWKTRKTRTLRVQPSIPDANAEVLVDRSFEDRYSDPGRPVEVSNDWGRPVLMLDGDTLYRIGAGASPEGDRPFLDAVDWQRGVTKRLFHSQAPFYEQPMMPIPQGSTGVPIRVLTRLESAEKPPNYALRSLTSADDGPRFLTQFPHPAPQLRGLSKELIRYQRADGVQLTATLYLPPGYDPEQGPLPMVMWAYPQEFKSAAAAGQVSDSPYRFTRISWWASQIWLARGYAVLDDPAMPIIGEGDSEPNDTFREQLVSSASAAVDEVVRLGVAQRGRIAIGGHSYGAFMTANLLAHSDLFAAGIARSGAYNRTLTPFGFQAEERTYWQAPEIYNTMSPFMHADKVDEPILMIHGEADNNSGTFPIQSERFYHALKGHGAVARLVMLPHESHGYQARESILHMLYETDRWLETYVKGGSADLETVPFVEGGEDHRGAAK